MNVVVGDLAMDEDGNRETTYQAGICPYCGSRELSVSEGEGNVTPTAAAKRVVGCGWEREHHIQYRTIGMRIFDEEDERAASRDVRLAESEERSLCATACTACPMGQVVSTFPNGLPRQVRWLIGLHLVAALLFLLFASERRSPEFLTVCLFSLFHLQLGLLGVWVGAGGRLFVARGLVVMVVGSALTLWLSLMDNYELDEFLPWLLPQLVVAAGLFTLVGQFGYRFHVQTHRRGLTGEANLQFSILHLLGLMTAIGTLIFLASTVRWLIRTSSVEEMIASLSFAGLDSLGIVIVCWAVLSGGQVTFRCALAFVAVIGLALLVLVVIDEWREEAIVFVGVAACFAYAALVATFSVLRTAGIRFGRERAIEGTRKQTL